MRVNDLEFLKVMVYSHDHKQSSAIIFKILVMGMVCKNRLRRRHGAFDENESILHVATN